jgi:RNA polymerase sigma-70 factor (ECF subfamily)
VDFDSLFRRLYPPLFRYLQRLTGDPDQADDLAQEAFTRLLRQPLPEREAKPWLFTVATNLVRDDARKKSRRERLLTVHGPVLPSPEAAADEVLERNERIEEVRRALAGLRPRDRQLLLMREEGFTYEEMAQAVGVAPSSVGTLLARALKRFMEVYRLCEVVDDAPN